MNWISFAKKKRLFTNNFNEKIESIFFLEIIMIAKPLLGGKSVFAYNECFQI